MTKSTLNVFVALLRGVNVGGNNMIRAYILAKCGGYNTALPFYGEDTDTAKRISRYGRVLFHPHLVMKTSARRFHDEGALSLETRYIFHFFKHALKHDRSRRDQS